MRNGGDAKNALLEAGYAPSTAENSTVNTAVKICQREILQELKVKDIDSEWLLNRYLTAEALAIRKEDPAAFVLITNSIAKYIVKEPDRIMDVSPQEQLEYEEIRRKITVTV